MWYFVWKYFIMKLIFKTVTDNINKTFVGFPDRCLQCHLDELRSNPVDIVYNII